MFKHTITMVMGDITGSATSLYRTSSKFSRAPRIEIYMETLSHASKGSSSKSYKFLREIYFYNRKDDLIS